MQRIGVLALQGDFREHARVVAQLGAEPVEVRLPAQLAALDGLILPGGESTTMRRLLADYALVEPLRERLAAGLPVLGTCAGAILLARQIAGEGPSPLGVMDLVVSRNAYGRQVDSFEAELDVPALGAPPVPAVFIRAPRILEIGPGVEVLARLDGGEVVAVRQGPRLALTFHPELTGDLRFHRYFLQQIVGRDDASGAA
ncbi:MAG TPA: pyridoxal 5'-phosphate synthase glutaminase subunit PdxT [Chloroflexota bacterium]|jgi:5'-phosphate synthase pdxT subunit|nr:pyridoxal 5'-phosphate synthase glutaminase subunit PdxT [Chloroflexota bacterium]